MSWLARLFWAVLAVAFFLIAALAVNQDKVAVQFLNWHTPELSLFWWLLVAFATGLLIGLFGITVSTTRLSLRNRRLARQLREAERELHGVRTVTFKE